MGNNTSTTTRKSTAGQSRHDTRKSSLSNANANLQSLYEDFNDSILHPVKRGESQPSEPQPVEPAPQIDYTTIPYNQFTNDLIEDEFNELNDGLIETEAGDLARNILPHSEFRRQSEDTDMPAYDDDAMEVDETTPTPDLSKVDFTKITNPIDTRSANTATDGRLSLYQLVKKARTNQQPASNPDKLIPVEIKWVNTNKEIINKISIIGSFSNWRDVIKLVPLPSHPNEFITTISLPLGVHKLLYIINNEYRVSDQLPTATDQEGIFFNWFEVIDEAHLFNHSMHQTNHPEDASTAFDANIISPDYHTQFHSTTSMSRQQAGKHDVERINRKSNSFLTKITKEQDFEHVEYMSQLNQDLQDFKDEQRQLENYPYHNESVNSSTKYVPYNEPLSSSASSFQKGGPKPSTTPKVAFSNEIPQMFVNYDYFKNKSPNYELPEPPQLPAHLNNVLLNKISQPGTGSQSHLTNIPQVPTSYHHRASDLRPPPPPGFDSGSVSSTSTTQFKRPPLRRADSSYYASNKEAYHLSVPNHVILNHLMTTSIRNEVLTVACITRYSGKFVTQIMHSPADK